MGVTTMTEEEAAAERAAAALDRADAALAAPRPWQGAADAYEAMAREAREREPDTARPSPSRAAPSPSPPAAADDGEAAFEGRPVRMGVMTRVLTQLVNEEREHAAQIIAALEARLAALETKGKRGKSNNGAR